MSAELLGSAMSVAMWIFIGGYVITSLLSLRTVRGSHASYVITTARVASCIGVAIIGVGKSVVDTMTMGPRIGVLNLITTLLYLALAYLASKGDDNWFSDQWKKFKRDLTRLRQRLANTLPQPAPSPA